MRRMKSVICLLLVVLLLLPTAVQSVAASTLSSQIKKDYKAVLKRYNDGYVVYDIDKNGIPELMVKSGTCEADYIISVYTHDGVSAVCLGEFDGFHVAYAAMKNKNGMYVQRTQMGWESIEVISIQDKKVVDKTISERHGVERVEDYKDLKNYLSEYDSSDLTGINRISTKEVAAPRDLKAASIKEKSIKLTWKHVINADGYVVYQYNTAKGDYQSLGATTQNNYTVKGLKIGTTYKFIVKSYVVKNGKRSYSVNGLVLTTSTKLATPKLSATLGNKAAYLKWNKVAGATAYLVYYSNQKSSGFKKLGSTAKIKATVENLKEGKTYYFKIRAYKKVGDANVYGGYSNVTRVSIPSGGTTARVKLDPAAGRGAVLNVRRGPGLDYEVIDTIPNGTVVTILKQKNGWSYISYGSGKTGWCNTEAAGF